MPVFLECISPELRSLLQDLSMTSTTKHILKLAPECEGNRDLMLKAGKMPSKMKTTDDDDDAPKAKKKRKKSAYNVFVGECQRGRPDGVKVTEQMSTCALRWKGMADGDKSSYQELADTANMSD